MTSLEGAAVLPGPAPSLHMSPFTIEAIIGQAKQKSVAIKRDGFLPGVG